MPITLMVYYFGYKYTIATNSNFQHSFILLEKK